MPYSGTVPFGVTIGIPAGTPEPSDVANNPGANMLWQALEDHGAMVRDTTSGNSDTVTFQADQTVDPNDPLIQGMDQFGSEIMAATQILTNQGPNSVNGGGTPIVPLDPPVSDASSSSGSNDAAITPDTLSSISGLTFVASSTDSGPGTTTSDTATTTPATGLTTTDFSTPAVTASTTTDPNGSSGGGYTVYTPHHGHADALATQQS